MTKAQHNTTEAADDLDPLDVAVDNILFPAIEAIQQTPRSRGKDSLAQWRQGRRQPVDHHAHHGRGLPDYRRGPGVCRGGARLE